MRIVIWGLKSISHSHRYIHEGFFEAFSRVGYECYWVDDKQSSNEYLAKNTLVISVNLACETLEYRADVKYVLHNVESDRFQNQSNVLKLQVFTKSAQGASIDESCSLYDQASRTLFQPWGIPTDPVTWMMPSSTPSDTEYWVGSIWNNELNQGNISAIAAFKEALTERGLKFKPANRMKIGMPAILGGRGLWLPTQISEADAAAFVHISPIGASIVGNWQREHKYVPCRIFKNLAAGQVVSSNADYSFIFGELGIYESNLEILLDKVMSLSLSEKEKRVTNSQEIMSNYTYVKSLQRILSVL